MARTLALATATQVALAFGIYALVAPAIFRAESITVPGVAVFGHRTPVTGR